MVILHNKKCNEKIENVPLKMLFLTKKADENPEI